MHNYQEDIDIKMQHFSKLRELCNEEIFYIKNEFKLSQFLKLQITKKHKEKLFQILEEMKQYFQKVSNNITKFNKLFEEKIIPRIVKENTKIQKEKIFIDTTLQKIKIKAKQTEFQLKMVNRERIFKLFDLLNTNVTTEILYNREVISKCNDFMNFIDYEINTIDTEYIHKKIIHKTKRKTGIIDTSNLLNKNNEVHIQKNKLTNILKEIELLSKRKKTSKKNLKKGQNNRMNNIDKLVYEISNLTKENNAVVVNKERGEREKILREGRIKQLSRIKNTKKQSILRMGDMSRKYTKLKNPMDLLVDKKILTKKKNKYQLNKEFLKSRKVLITKKMQKRMKRINKNLKHAEKINSNITFYNSKEKI